MSDGEGDEEGFKVRTHVQSSCQVQLVLEWKRTKHCMKIKQLQGKAVSPALSSGLELDDL